MIVLKIDLRYNKDSIINIFYSKFIDQRASLQYSDIEQVILYNIIAILYIYQLINYSMWNYRDCFITIK